ncbi:MAG: L-rhamnose mutarotase [Candidatus Binataceae bacterium]
MKIYGQTINLKTGAGIERRYVEMHRAAYPEVERGLQAIGIRRMLIWKLGRQLFMMMETEDSFNPDRDFPRYENSHPRIKEWQDTMAAMQEPVAGAPAGQWWARMELVYSLVGDGP